MEIPAACGEGPGPLPARPASPCLLGAGMEPLGPRVLSSPPARPCSQGPAFIFDLDGTVLWVRP